MRPVLALVVAMGQPAVASAAPVDLGDRTELEVHGLAQAGVLARPGPAGASEVSTYLSMARLQTKLRHADQLTTTLQVEAAGGQVELLDAVVEVHPTRDLAWRVGRFKTPVSREFLEPASELPLVRRPMVTALTPGRRVGTEVAWTPSIGAAESSLQVGIYEGPDDELLGAGASLGVVRASLELRDGIGLHAAAARNLLGGDREPYDTVFDGAVTYTHGRVRLLAEGVRATSDDGEQAGGAGLEAAYRLDGADEVEWEPALGLDLVADEEGMHPRGTAGVNLYLAGHHLVQTLDVEVEEDEQGHATAGIYAQLRGGF